MGHIPPSPHVAPTLRSPELARAPSRSEPLPLRISHEVCNSVSQQKNLPHSRPLAPPITGTGNKLVFHRSGTTPPPPLKGTLFPHSRGRLSHCYLWDPVVRLEPREGAAGGGGEPHGPS